MKSFVATVWFLLLFVGLFDKNMTSEQYLENVGCFDLSYALTKSYHRHMSNVTLQMCSNHCRARGTKYAGIEKSDNFCYCGSDIPYYSLKRDDGFCNVPCPDNSSAVCGGDWLMSVYLLDSPQPTGQTQVAFLIGLSTGVVFHNFSSLNSNDTIMKTEDWADSVDYHLTKNLAFAFVKPHSIYKSTLEPRVSSSSAVPTLVKNVSRFCSGFAVDWETDRMYWANCESGDVDIMYCNFLSCDETAKVLSRPGDPVTIANMIIDPYERLLFWVGDSVIESCTLDGSNFRTNISDPETNVRFISLDLSAHRLYYVGIDKQGSALHSLDYMGSDSKQHFRLSTQFKMTYGLGVFRGYVYWVSFDRNKDVIYQAPLNLTDIKHVKVLSTVEKAVWHMKLVHPELQMRPASDPCGKKGCSHSCIVTSLVANCTCPQGFQLDNNGITCINTTQSSLGPVSTTVKAEWIDPVSTTVKEEWIVTVTSGDERSAASQTRPTSRLHNTTTLLVMISVGAVMLVLGLLYFVNYHWPSIKSKLSRGSLPYTRQRPQREEKEVNPQYDTADDNVNLI